MPVWRGAVLYQCRREEGEEVFEEVFVLGGPEREEEGVGSVEEEAGGGNFGGVGDECLDRGGEECYAGCACVGEGGEGEAMGRAVVVGGKREADV